MVDLEKLDLVYSPVLLFECVGKSNQLHLIRTEWICSLIECSCSRPASDGGLMSGLGLSCSTMADTIGSTAGGMLLWLIGGGVLARVGLDSLSGHPPLPCYPHIYPPPSPLTPQGISRLFWRGPWGPFHHYTHDSLIQQAPGRCMGERVGEGVWWGVAYQLVIASSPGALSPSARIAPLLYCVCTHTTPV